MAGMVMALSSALSQYDHLRNEREANFVPINGENIDQDKDDTDGTRGHLHQDRGERIEAETLGNETSKRSNTTGWDGNAEEHSRPHVCLDVGHRFTELRLRRSALNLSDDSPS